MKLRLFLKRLLFVIIIIGLLLMASFAYFELNKDKLLADFKIFVQTQLSKSTGKTVTFGDLEGGILSGITLNKLVIAQTDKDNETIPVFEAEQLILNYRYWDILLGRFDHLRYMRLNTPVLYPSIFAFNNLAKQDKLSLELVNLFSWVQKKNKIFIFIDNGSLTLDKKHSLLSKINGQLVVTKESLKCSLLKGYILGTEVNFRGLVTKLDQAIPQIDLTLSLDGDWAKGFCRIQDSLWEPTVMGAFNFGKDRELDFTGKLLVKQGGLNFKNFLINNRYIFNANMDLSKKDGYLTVEDENKNNILESTFSFYSDFSFLNQTKCNHIKLFGYDLLTSVIVMGNLVAQEPKTFSGYIASSGTIIDYNPVNELEILFTISPETITLSSLKFGNTYEISSNIGLSKPYPLDLNLTVTRAQLSDLLIFAKNKKETNLSGQFDGQVKITGFVPNNLEVNGHLEGHNGNIGTIKYGTASINFKGSGSVIYLDGSRIFRPEEGKYLTLDGFIDLAKFGSGSLLQDLKISSDEKTIIWKGWDITKKPEDTKLSFQKDVGSEFKVGFSTFINDERGDNLKKDKDAIELQYNFSQNRSIKLRLKDNEEMVGVEHKVEF